MSEGPQGRRRLRRVLTGLAVVMVVVLIGLVAYLAGRDHGPATSTGTAAPGPLSPSPSSSPWPAVTAATGYLVAAGSGGTGVASDGVTKIGYGPSCEEAVQAATNYMVSVDEAMATDRWTAASFKALLDQLNAGLDGGDIPGSTGGMRADLETQYATIRTQAQQFEATYHTPAPVLTGHSRPEWGAYLVRACAARSQAVVDITTYWDEPGSEPSPNTYRVSLSWFGDDWRLTGFEKADAPAGSAEPSTKPVPASSRRAWMVGSGEAWTEYTNAPQQ